MPNMFRSEDTSIPETQAEVISVTDSSPAPDAPPTTPLEPIAEVESTHHGDAEEVPADVQQYFHMEDEAEEPAPEGEGEAPAPVVDETVSNVEVEAPAEAPAEAPMDAPAALPGADALPADAPVSPSAVPAVAPDGTPLTPAATPIADVPTAAPIAPQPETDVAPMVPQVGEDGAPAPIEAPVEAPTAPTEEPVETEPTQFGAGLKQEDEGEPISVVETPEPRMPTETETNEEGETVADIKEPIAPVISQEDEATDAAAAVDGTVPVESDIHDDITTLTPQEAQSASDVQTEMSMFRQEEEVEAPAVEPGEDESNVAGDQNVDVSVHVDGQTVDGETPTEPEVTQRMRQEDAICDDQPEEPCSPPIETVADISSAPADAPVADGVVDDVVPSPDQAFNSMLMDGGGWE